MALIKLDKAPFIWFGGKTDAAPAVWEALGNPDHFVDPFCGSLAVLLLRPHLFNRPYNSETVNDANGLLINAWRSIQLHPDATAEAASNPVAEADLMARHLALLKWKNERQLEHLMGDPLWCDPLMGGWYLWGVSSWIGSGWCDGTGPWIVGADGRITKQPKAGGVNRNRPHLSNNSQGVNRPQARELGVRNQLPHLSNDGQGVNRPQAREPGVRNQLPSLTDDGRGVNHAGTREPGVAPGTPDRPWEEDDFHPMTMPELRRWFAFLSARLRHVRILNGDWTRTVTTGASHTLPVRQGKGVCGYFLDPPYSQDERTAGLYAHDTAGIAAAVRAWCLANGDNPKNRIVLAGFVGEGHEELEQHGWRVGEWFREGWLKGGMGNQVARDEDGATGHQQARERLWLSPHCDVGTTAERGLFDDLV